MARIRFDIASALARWPRRRARGEVSEQRFRMMNLEALREMALGPGWFDSSWDLGQGLEVDIVLPDDPAFAAWLDALTRLPEPAATASPATQAKVALQDMLEFQPIDWQAGVPAVAGAGPGAVAAAGRVIDPTLAFGVADPTAPLLELELPDFAFEPVPARDLELALVPI